MNESSSIRLNIISKTDNSHRLSLITSPKSTIAKLKRTIEHQFHELYNLHVLISHIEDVQGFVLSNNSNVGDHLKHNDTVYVQQHREKMGDNMNLGGNLGDLFMTLRYVSGSVIRKLTQIEQNQMMPLDVVPQIIHLGFWYSNIETVNHLCKLLNKIFTPEAVDNYVRQAHQMQQNLLLKMMFFWFAEVKQSAAAFPEVIQELLTLIYKLSLNRIYCQMLGSHKISKSILQLSKSTTLKPQLKRMTVQTIRNIAGKGQLPLKTQSSSPYFPTTMTVGSTTALNQSAFELNNIEEVLQAMASGSQQNKAEALQELVQHPRMITEATVRFDYYWKVTGMFLMRNIKDKTAARVFSQVLKQLSSHTTKEKAAQIMQKDIIKRIHNFLLDSHIDAHSAVFDYYTLISRQSAVKGVFNIQQASELLTSPYPQFKKISAQALAQMSDRKVSPIRFLPAIKDYLRIALKTQDQSISTFLVKTIGNLTLDEQCRYQIVNLKGIEVLIKFLQIGQRSNNAQMQRAAAKGLLNLSIASRQSKARVLGLLTGILQRFYQGGFDSIAGSYIDNILKAPKS